MNDLTLINVSIENSYAQKIVYERNSAGIFSLVSSLEAAGFKPGFHEFFIDAEKDLELEIERFITMLDAGAGTLGIGCHSVHLPFVLKAAEAFKNNHPERTVILGGIGPSSSGLKIIERFPYIDAVVIGEAEDTLVELMRSGTDPAGIKGIMTRSPSGSISYTARGPIRDLDRLPLPAYHKLDTSRYKVPTVITSRGCDNNCPFCSLCRLWGTGIRSRSPRHVLRELEILHEKYGFEYIFFGDPTFNFDRDRTIEICRLIQESGLDIKWECLVRTNRMDPELMRHMSDAGCEAVFYGLESGSENVLNKIKKNSSVRDSLKVIQESCDYFPTVEVSLMWGFPFETLDDLKETISIRDCLERGFSCEMQLRWLEPYPATPLFDEYADRIFMPRQDSLIYDIGSARSRIRDGKVFYDNSHELDSIKIATDVTNVRFIIAASHIAASCGDLINEHPDIFCDFYRYETPSLEEKLALVNKYSVY